MNYLGNFAKRRMFLLLLALTLLPSALAQVVIVGGGIAGLTALHELRKKGIDAVLYEAADTTGGRISSFVNKPTGLVVNAGAELVDTDHHYILNLMKEFGIETLPHAAPEGYRSGDFLYEGLVLTPDEVKAKIFANNPAAMKKWTEDTRRIEEGRRTATAVERKSPSAPEQMIDGLNIAQYLDRIGADPFLHKWIRATMESENGQPIEKQSAILLFDYLRVNADTQSFAFLPDNDEAYRIKGGSKALTDAMSAKYKDFIKTGYKAETVTRTNNDTIHYDVKFNGPEGKSIQVPAQNLVMALPYPALKGIDFQPELPADIRKAVNETSYGEHTKLIMFFNKRRWNELHHSGDLMSGKGYEIWDSSQGQPGKFGSLTAYLGTYDDSVSPELRAREILKELETIFPGITQDYVGAEQHFWPASYSGIPKPGEYTRIRARTPRGVDLFFVGEAFSKISRGYMNGAAETGFHAAMKIVEVEGRRGRFSCNGFPPPAPRAPASEKP